MRTSKSQNKHVAKISCNKVYLGMFFPVRFTFHRKFGDLEIFLSVLNKKIISAQPQTRRSYPPPTAHPSPKARLTFAKREMELSRVNVRKDFSECFWRQRKNIGQQRASQPLFGKSDRKDRLFKFKIQENIGIFCQNVGSLQEKKLFSVIKNCDFVNSQQSCFTLRNADIRICPI